MALTNMKSLRDNKGSKLSCYRINLYEVNTNCHMIISYSEDNLIHCQVSVLVKCAYARFQDLQEISKENCQCDPLRGPPSCS